MQKCTARSGLARREERERPAARAVAFARRTRYVLGIPNHRADGAFEREHEAHVPFLPVQSIARSVLPGL